LSLCRLRLTFHLLSLALDTRLKFTRLQIFTIDVKGLGLGLIRDRLESDPNTWNQIQYNYGITMAL